MLQGAVVVAESKSLLGELDSFLELAALVETVGVLEDSDVLDLGGVRAGKHAQSIFVAVEIEQSDDTGVEGTRVGRRVGGLGLRERRRGRLGG